MSRGGRQPDVAGQLELLAADIESSDLAERFRAFHEANPAVGIALARITRDWLERTGQRRAAIGLMFELLRWETNVSNALDNSYKPFYARWLMANHSDLRGVFETRTSVADQAQEAA